MTSEDTQETQEVLDVYKLLQVFDIIDDYDRHIFGIAIQPKSYPGKLFFGPNTIYCKHCKCVYFDKKYLPHTTCLKLTASNDKPILSPVLSLVDDESWTHIINLEMIGAYTSEELCNTLAPLYDQLQLQMQSVAC